MVCGCGERSRFAAHFFGLLGQQDDAGFIKELKEGGLAIDFTKNGKQMRLILGYNDLWVEYLGVIKKQEKKS